MFRTFNLIIITRKSVIIMYNIIKYLLLLTTVGFVIVDGEITYGCYTQPTSPCSQHTLTCPDDDVIAVDESIVVNKIAYGRKRPGYKCRPNQMEVCNSTCCRYQGTNEDVGDFISVNQTDRLSVYRTCSNQPTCTVTSPYSPDTGYDYIRYIYKCLPVVLMYNMMEITDVSFPYNGYLYYSGKSQTASTTITRCCNITSTEMIITQSIYIDLTEESSYSVKIYSGNQTLLRCIDEGGLFYGYEELSMSGATMYHVVLDNLTVEEDDYIWIFIKSNSNISITCDECAAFAASSPQMNECLSESGYYGKPGSSCSTYALTCDEGQVISIDERNEKRKIHYGTKFNPSCNAGLDTTSRDNKKCCRRNIADEHSPVDRDDRLQVYKNCSNKRTCSLTSPYTPNARYNYIYYPYICIPDNLVYNIINIDVTTFPDEAYLYISNQQPYSGSLSCSLTSLQTVRIESVFINLSLKSCSKIQIFLRNQDLLNCSTDVISLGSELKVTGENITVQIEDFTDEGESVMWIKVYGGPSIACTRHLPQRLVPGTVQDSSDQLGLIIGCVVGIVVIILVVVVVVVYCIIRRRRKKSGDNHQELEYTTKNNRRESEYGTIQDDDTNKRESSYHTIEDSFLQNSTKDRKSAGGPSNETLTYQVIDRDFSAKCSNIATPKENLTCQDIDHATFPNTASPKHDTNYTVIDYDFTAKASQSRAPEEETGYTYIGHDFGTKAAKLPSTQSPKDESNYTDIDNVFSYKSIDPVGSPPNKASPKHESNYHIIDDDFSVKPKPGSGCCDPWDSSITLEPRSGLSTSTLDSKGKYSVVKPKNLRRQGEGKPSEYDHISTKTTAVNLGKEELLDPNYDHFKHTSFTPVVNENTYYDHIPKDDEESLSDPNSDPTYDHLGEKGQTTKPQHDIASSQYQPRKSKTNVDDPTYNHLVEKGSTTKPQQGNTVFPNRAFHGENNDVDDPFIDPTYNHLGENSHPLQQDNSENVDDPNNDDTYNHLGAKGHTPQPQENVDDPNNDDTYNHLGAKGHTLQPQEGNHNTKGVDPNNDPTYNHLGANTHALQQDNSKDVDDPNNDDTYNHLGAKGHTPQPQEGNHSTKGVDDPNNNDTYNHLGETGHTPQPPQESSDPTSDSQWRADDPTYNHLGDDKPESQKH